LHNSGFKEKPTANSSGSSDEVIKSIVPMPNHQILLQI